MLMRNMRKLQHVTFSYDNISMIGNMFCNKQVFCIFKSNEDLK